MTASNSSIEPAATFNMLHASPVIRWISMISAQPATAGSLRMQRDP
jgi:hypothetical protein